MLVFEGKSNSVIFLIHQELVTAKRFVVKYIIDIFDFIKCFTNLALVTTTPFLAKVTYMGFQF